MHGSPTVVADSPLVSLERAQRSQAPICVAATATALPPYSVGIEEVKAYLDIVFPLSESRRSTMLEVIENTQIERRYTVFPAAYTIVPRPLEQTSREYQEQCVALGRRATSECLERAGLQPTDIDLFMTVSCTGIMIPSLDAYLINELGFRSDVRRLPITELGCAAGAAALGRAWDFLRGLEKGNVLIVAVELPSLTFQRRNFSPANLISSALFGDGAAAAVISRDGAGGNGGGSCGAGVAANGAGSGHALGPRILAAQSHLFPHTLDAMGFELKDSGLHIVLSKDVPQLIRDHIRELIDTFLARFGMRQSDLAAFVLHPGGQKLLQFIEEELGISREMTQFSWDVLRDYGNLSSASVLFVLQEQIRRGHVPSGGRGLLAAFGPGFSAEMLLLEWA
jgi:alkylresorcinol/alkylpyrone synthase